MTPRTKHIIYRENFSPPQLPGLQAWYDLSVPTSYITATGVKLLGDLSGNSNTNAWVSGGAASNTATAPTASITGNQTLTADIQFADYTPGTNHVLFSKVNGNSGITWTLLTTGVSRLTIGDGAALTNFDSTVAIPATDLVRGTLQVVYTDNTSMVTTWNGVAVGTTVTVNKVLANGAATATIGTTCNGVIYSLTVGNVYNFAPTTAGKLAASFVAPTTGETWTINTSGDLGARICGARDLVQMTGANQPTLTAGAIPFITFDGVSQYLKCAAFSLPQPTTIYLIGQQKTWTSGDNFWDGNAQNSGHLQQDTSSPNVRTFAGNSSGDLAVPLAANMILSAVYNSTSSSLRYNKVAGLVGVNTGTAAMNGFILGAQAAVSVGFGNIQVNAVLVYNVAQDVGTQNRVIDWASRRYSIPV